MEVFKLYKNALGIRGALVLELEVCLCTNTNTPDINPRIWTTYVHVRLDTHVITETFTSALQTDKHIYCICLRLTILRSGILTASVNPCELPS